MTEFEIFKMALEKAGDKIHITKWDKIGEALIEDLTEEVDFYFKDGKLDYVCNLKR